MADIFISYAREDAAWVGKLAAAIEAAGYSVWWDRNLATGARYLKETETQLRSAKATVVVWSRTSIDSHWVADEAALARDLGRLAPISMDGSTPPLGFGQYQATDFSRWRGGDGGGEPMQMLLQALAAMAQRPAPAPPKRKAKKRGSPVPVMLLMMLIIAIAGAAAGAWRFGWFGVNGERVVPGAASVAVTPFKDLSAAGDQTHLANGMTVELLSRLRTIDNLTVAGGDWMAEQVGKTGGDPQALGQLLSVNYILEGDVRTEGESVRVNARLVRCSDRQIVWSPKPYERSKNSIFAIQEEIAASVANALSVALDIGLQSTSHGGTSNFEAYDHYLRGRYLRNRGDPMLAVDELTQAVTLDPNYARAWSELNVAWGTVARLATTAEAMESSLQKMDETSRKAEALAPDMWFGHTPRGWYFLARNDWVNAEAAFVRALALGDVPDPELYATEAAFQNQIGRRTQTERLHARLLAIDPRHGDRFMARMQIEIKAGNYEESWRIYQESRQVAPGFDFLREYTALWGTLAAGEHERTRGILKALEATDPRYADVSARLEAPDEMLALVREFRDDPRSNRGRLTFAALLAGQYGDPELAVDLLRRAFLGPGWAGHFQMWFPQFAEARKTDAFKQFVRDLGFVEMWRKSGDWGDYCRPVSEDDFICI